MSCRKKSNLPKFIHQGKLSQVRLQLYQLQVIELYPNAIEKFEDAEFLWFTLQFENSKQVIIFYKFCDKLKNLKVQVFFQPLIICSNNLFWTKSGCTVFTGALDLQHQSLNQTDIQTNRALLERSILGFVLIARTCKELARVQLMLTTMQCLKH